MNFSGPEFGSVYPHKLLCFIYKEVRKKKDPNKVYDGKIFELRFGSVFGQNTRYYLDGACHLNRVYGYVCVCNKSTLCVCVSA